VPLVMVAWNRRIVATPMGVKRCGRQMLRHGRHWHRMVREIVRRRISPIEWLGFGLLAAALVQGRYRRESAALSMRTHRARSKLGMTLDPPGATVGLVAQTLLSARRRR
jgi:hypothetical protein